MKKVFLLLSFVFLLLTFYVSISANEIYEIKELRTQCSKSYELDNNLIETNYYTTPVHYIDDLKYKEFDYSYINDGTWAHKIGTGNSHQLPNNFTPNDDDSWTIPILPDTFAFSAETTVYFTF